MCMDYNELARFIEGELPGRGIWFQSAASEFGEGTLGQQAPEAEGLAIRRDDEIYLLIYFSIVVDESLDPDEDIPSTDDLELYAGFTGEYDTLQEAKREAQQLVDYLPRPAFMSNETTRKLIFDAIDELEDEE